MGEDWRLIKSTEYTYLSKLNVTYSDDLELYWLNISQEKLYSYGYIDVNVSILNTSFTTFYGMYRVSLCNLDGSVIKNIGIKYETQGLGYNYYYVNGFNLSSTLDVEPGTYLLQVAYKREGTDSWYYIGTSYANSPIFIEVLDPNVEEEILSEDQYEYNNTYTSAYALSYELQNDETTLNVAANIHEESYSNDVDYYSIATEKGYDYEIDVKLYDKYNQNLDETLTADVLFTYLIEGGSVSNIYDNSLTIPILIEGGQNVIICIEPYMHTLLGTYELEINIKRTKIQYYNVVVESANAAMGWTDGSGTYREGQSVSMQAYSHEGHHFVKWSDGNTDNPRTIVVTQDVTFTAEFAINTYNVIVNANENGSVTGSGTYNHGDTITLIATANEHYHFVKWSDGNTDNPRKYVVTSDATLTAEFTIDTHNVVVNASNCTVAGAGTHNYGDTITLTITPDEGYEFVKWSDGNTDNPRTIIVTEDITLSAELELISYIVTLSCNESHGTVTGSGTYNHGDTITLIATANEHYHFVKWSDGNTDNPRKYVVTSDATLTAEFTIDTHNVVVNASNCTVAGAGTHNYGDTITLTITPDEGYEFVKWSDGNTDNPRTIIVTEDITLGVELELMTYIVTVSCNEIHGVVSGSGTYKYGETVVLTATANDGYEFAQWSDGTTDNPYSIIVQKDLTLEAQFVPATAVHNIETKENQSIKMIRNGQLLIIRDGKTYNAMGKELK